DERQRVVLRADREMQGTASDAARERGRKGADAEVDGKAGVSERTRRPRTRLHFLELQLGVRVNAMTERDERVLRGVDGRPSRCLGLGRGRGHAGSVALCSTPTKWMPQLRR